MKKTLKEKKNKGPDMFFIFLGVFFIVLASFVDKERNTIPVLCGLMSFCIGLFGFVDY